VLPSSSSLHRCKKCLWAGLTDERVKLTQEVIQGIRVIKFFTWEKPFEALIGEVRTKELKEIFNRSIMNAGVFTLAFTFPTLASTIAFSVYAVTQSSFNPANLFSALSWFAQLRLPLMFLPQILTNLAEFRVAVSRIQELFEAQEVEEKFVIDRDAEFAVQVQDGSFLWDSLTESVSKTGEVPATDVVAPPNEPHVHDINIKITKGKLVAIVGVVGSGKSSLLNSLIGETKSIS
jgi:ATP-binding cassette, subfamily C (CFTR/MRP), member 1